MLEQTLTLKQTHASVREEEPLRLPIDWKTVKPEEADKILSTVRGLSMGTRELLRQVAKTIK